MTVGFLQEYIPRRMRELGHGDGYELEMRSIILRGGETIAIPAHKNWIWAPLDLIATAGNIEISGEFGFYSATGAKTRENHYEFSGRVTVKSNEAAGQPTSLTIMVATLRSNYPGDAGPQR